MKFDDIQKGGLYLYTDGEGVRAIVCAHSKIKSYKLSLPSWRFTVIHSDVESRSSTKKTITIASLHANRLWPVRIIGIDFETPNICRIENNG